MAVIEGASSESVREPEKAKPASPKHIDFVDGLRATAALYVMLHHIWWQIWPQELHRSPHGLMLALTQWLFYGHFAVSVFLAISGFCLMLPIVKGDGALRGGAFAFYKRRARRILPPYYAAMALSLVLIWTLIGKKTGTHWDVSIPVTWKGFIVHALLLQNLLPSDQINHVFWSIAVEWQIYFLFPLLLIFWKRIGPAATTTAALALSLMLYVATGKLHLSIIAPHYLGLFVLGMLAATLAYGRDEWSIAVRSKVPWGIASAALFVTVVVLCHHFGPERPHTEIMDFLVGFCALSTLVHLAGDGPSLLRQVMSLKPLVFVGGFSYSLYLIHAPLIQVVWQYVVAPMHLSDNAAFLATMAMSTPFILIASYLFYLVAERPFMSPSSRKSETGKTAIDGERTKALGLRHNFSWAVLGSVVFGVTNLGMQMVLAKLGTPRMLAEYVLGVSITQPVLLFSQLNLRTVQATDTLRQYRFSHYFWLRVILTLVAMVVFAVLAGTGPYAAEARAVILLTGLGVAFDSISDIVYGAYQQSERLDRMGISMIAKGFLNLALLTIFLLHGHTVVWAIAGSVLSSILVVTFYDIPCGWWFARMTGDETAKVTPASLLKLAWLALPLGVTMLFASLYGNFPRYFLIKMHDVTDLAYLAAPSTAMAMGVYIVGIFSQPISPRLARSARAGDRKAFMSLFGKLSACVWLLGGAILLISIFGGRELITLVFARVYANHIDVFEWMMVATAIFYASLVCGTGITALGRFKVQMLWSGAAAIVSFISSWVLVPRYGVVGVAMAVCATMLARLLIGYVILGWAIRNIGETDASMAAPVQPEKALEPAPEVA